MNIITRSRFRNYTYLMLVNHRSFKSGFLRHPGAMHGGNARCAQGGAIKAFITWVGPAQV